MFIGLESFSFVVVGTLLKLLKQTGKQNKNKTHSVSWRRKNLLFRFCRMQEKKSTTRASASPRYDRSIFYELSPLLSRIMHVHSLHFRQGGIGTFTSSVHFEVTRWKTVFTFIDLASPFLSCLLPYSIIANSSVCP